MTVPRIVLLIDAHALIHRAFHALPPLTGPAGQPTGALYGLARILMKVAARGGFTHCFAAFDRPEPTHRKDAFADYKAHRPKAPDELVSQFIEARELFRAFGIPVVEMPKVEADDLIGTLAARFAEERAEVVILTGDLDALQLVRDPAVKVETFKKGVTETAIYDEAAVRERYGFGPEHIPDLKGIMGDASDNIRGVPGVGEGSALKLIRTYGGIDKIYRALKQEGVETVAARAGIQARFAKIMAAHEEDARFSKKLALIDTKVPISANLAEGRFKSLAAETLRPYFARMEFGSLLKDLETRATEKRNEDEGAAEFPPSTIFVADAEEARARLAELDHNAEKIAYAWKLILKSLDSNARVAPPLFDLSIAGWMVDPDGNGFSREELLARFLPNLDETNEFDSSKKREDAALYRFLKEKILSYGLANLFYNVEMPLIPILAAMERAGVGASRARLAKLTRAMRAELATLEAQIHRAAGGPFNLNSPRQVAEVLFERLKLGAARQKKTKTGQRRTGRDILAELEKTHPAVALLLEYRETFKVFSSFVEPLATAIAEDGRIHTTFLQTGTATGRLSSANPNLQNIPQESKWANELRAAFVAPRGSLLVSFDYSQLELRLLAHASGDEALREVFRAGADIHTLTAGKIFSVAPRAVTPPMRRTAKTLNFGIVYGMGIRAFAASSGLPPAEAKKFVDEYFRQFPRVQEWQERVKAEARARGYVTNEHGRRRWFLPPTNRTNKPSKTYRSGEWERAAINMPLQSLGADIMKTAMIGVDELLKQTDAAGARAILSIHDELLFEMPRGMLSTLVPRIKAQMESAAALSIPLRVEVRGGSDWGSMKPI